MSEKVDDVITRIVPWKSGKGCFVNFAGLDFDFYLFGQLDAKIGDTLEGNAEKGTNKFSEKYQLTQWKITRESEERPESVQSFAKETQRELAKTESYITTRDDSIRRAVALKAAVEASPKVSAVATAEAVYKATITLLLIADRFDAWLSGDKDKEALGA